VGGADKHLLHDVFFLAGHAGNAAAAPLLGLIGGLELALDIACLGEGVDALLLGNEVLDVHFTVDALDLGAALVAKPLLHLQQLVLDDLQHPGVVGQDIFPILDLCLQCAQLFLDL